MATRDIIAAASQPTFYTRVSFLALKTAQNVASEDPSTPNHANRLAYANRVLRGEDKALLLALHIAAANNVIAGGLEEVGESAIPDADIEFVLSTIWDARANAFAAGVAA
ncbi:hypothetical protein [Microvirga massiliensis]|uniref:hypothetical protein n=1 Tax=Microvirga massiliensis TaxID=1033741 RepID=UPI00062BD32F|nr:hypothetical protein [Microvirga massiliensis]